MVYYILHFLIWPAANPLCSVRIFLSFVLKSTATARSLTIDGTGAYHGTATLSSRVTTAYDDTTPGGGVTGKRSRPK
jgi:hypothetical protein